MSKIDHLITGIQKTRKNIYFHVRFYRVAGETNNDFTNIFYAK